MIYPYKLKFKSLEPYISNKSLFYHYNNYYHEIYKITKSLLEINKYIIYDVEEILVNYNRYPKNIIKYLITLYNHNLFFSNLSDNPKDNIFDDIIFNLQIIKDFTTYDNLINNMYKLIENNLNIKWIFLCINNLKELILISCEDNYTPLLDNLYPILVLDFEEHSYYTDYPCNKITYFDNLLKIINWKEVIKRFNLYHSY